MIDETFVEKIAELQRESTELLDIAGRQFVAIGGELKEIRPDMASALQAQTLGALRDYLVENPDDLLTDDLTVQIVSPTNVRVISQLNTLYRHRETLLIVKAQLPPFSYGKYYPQDEFMIALQTRFAPSDDRFYLQEVAGHLVSEESVNLEDDGISQNVTLKKGVRKVATTAKPIVRLAPFRTFTEIVQPESDFLVRIGDGGTIALFDADGGAWQRAAIEGIKGWIEEQVATVTDVMVLA